MSVYPFWCYIVAKGYVTNTERLQGVHKIKKVENPSLNEGYMKKRRGYMRGTGETEPQSQWRVQEEKKRVHEGYRRDRTPVSMKDTWEIYRGIWGVQKNRSLKRHYGQRYPMPHWLHSILSCWSNEAVALEGQMTYNSSQGNFFRKVWKQLDWIG